ncbi:hypothetical protein MTO96_022949 [Rhipicephalus appendiculatus]
MAAGIISRDNRKANQRLPQRAREERGQKKQRDDKVEEEAHTSVQGRQFEVCLISEATPAAGGRITQSSRRSGTRPSNQRSRSFAFKCDYVFEIKVRPSRFAVGRTRLESLSPLRHPRPR